MNRCKGFTFIEITIVILIICILMAIGLPRLKGTLVDFRLKSAARDVTAILRYARSAAVLRELPCEVCFDVENDTYELVLLDDSGEPQKQKHSSRHSRRKEDSRLSIGDDVAGLRILPKDIHFATIYTAAPLSEASKLPCVTYYADGSATAATIAIQDVKAHAISVEIYQTTGMARVEPGLPPEKDQPKSRMRYYGPKQSSGASS